MAFGARRHKKMFPTLEGMLIVTLEGGAHSLGEGVIWGVFFPFGLLCFISSASLEFDCSKAREAGSPETQMSLPAWGYRTSEGFGHCYWVVEGSLDL